MREPRATPPTTTPVTQAPDPASHRNPHASRTTQFPHASSSSQAQRDVAAAARIRTLDDIRDLGRLWPGRLDRRHDGAGRRHLPTRRPQPTAAPSSCASRAASRCLRPSCSTWWAWRSRPPRRAGSWPRRREAAPTPTRPRSRRSWRPFRASWPWCCRPMSPCRLGATRSGPFPCSRRTSIALTGESPT